MPFGNIFFGSEETVVCKYPISIKVNQHHHLTNKITCSVVKPWYTVWRMCQMCRYFNSYGPGSSLLSLLTFASIESVVFNAHVYTTTQIVRGGPLTSLAQSIHPDISRLFVLWNPKPMPHISLIRTARYRMFLVWTLTNIFLQHYGAISNIVLNKTHHTSKKSSSALDAITWC